MKKFLGIIAVLAVVGGLAAYGYAHSPTANGINGYVEGEFTRIGPTTAGILDKLLVERGDHVKAGQPLFALDLTKLQADVAAAQAAKAQAEAAWQDLTKGKRPEEIDAIEQQKAQAEAVLTNADKQWKRTRSLARQNSSAVSKAQMDADHAAFDNATAKVSELTADLKTATMGAREDQIAAARAAIDQTAQKVAQAQKTLAEAAPVAPADADVEDTFYRPGEEIAAFAPVVSLLAPEDVKIRFFVPERTVPQLRLGQAVRISCDGCRGPIDAKINFIAHQAEYTPPVIYSVESRQKLVFMVEARPVKYDPQLRPGLPVSIALGQP